MMTPVLFEIVLNNCTDSTETIVKPFCEKFKWIHYSLFNNNAKRNYANKATAFNTTHKRIAGNEFEFIGNLDADIVLPAYYYQLVIQKFHENLKLGIAGGHFYEFKNNRRKKNFEFSPTSISGGVQLFRKDCFETIGGYRPIITGGIDMYAEITARYSGWETRCYPEIHFIHSRPLGTAQANALIAKFLEGVRDSAIGYNSLYFFVKCIRRLLESPIFFGSICRLTGFLYAKIKYREKVLSSQVCKFLHEEQRKRLYSLLPAKMLFQKKND